MVYANNLYKTEGIENNVYISCSEKIESFTGDKSYFMGTGGISNPQAIKIERLNNSNGLGKNTCIAYEIEIEIENFGTKEISIVLGAEDSIIDCKNTAYKYSKIANCKQELLACKNYWKEMLRTTSGIYAIRIYEYNVKWVDSISNISK